MCVSLHWHYLGPSGDVWTLGLMFKQLPREPAIILMYEKTCVIPILFSFTDYRRIRSRNVEWSETPGTANSGRSELYVKGYRKGRQVSFILLYTFRGQKFHLSARNYEWIVNIERTRNSSQALVLKNECFETNYSRESYYILLPYVIYCIRF